MVLVIHWVEYVCASVYVSGLLNALVFDLAMAR